MRFQLNTGNSKNSQKVEHLSCEIDIYFVSLPVISQTWVGTLRAPYLSIDNELGEDENIDRSPVPQEMFTPRISGIHLIFFSWFRIYLSVEKCPHVSWVSYRP